MPNWNSCTMPVTTPMAKLIRKILPKKRVRCSHFRLPVRNHAVWKIETVSAMPSVSGTKRKWYSVVRPNCQRASSRGSSRSMMRLRSSTDVWSDHTVARGRPQHAIFEASREPDSQNRAAHVRAE